MLNTFPSSFAKQLFLESLKHALFTFTFTCLQPPCLCWCIAASLGALAPPVDQWNSVKPLAGIQIMSPACAE